MSQALSNSSFSLALPLPSKTITRNPRNLSIKAQASRENRDNNLDNQQRPSGTKKRVPTVAPIGLWDRFPTAKTVQQMMERMMEDPFVYSGERGGYNNSRGRLPWEIKEGENEYKMRMDMPGMTKDDVKVWVDEEKMLVVKAEKVPKKKENNNSNGGGVVLEVEEEDWSAKSYGRYSSRIALPENVHFEKITAEVKEGVLYITIPKASIDHGMVFDINVQ
ncbi:hypothetical protein LWI28_005265 [Acer negundo]|uniref:SHSP domain-containing protein n=1 Tax=Acer negundo TaxID=4023 RepID=A0AAD5IKK1_ACENE|nr:hypothetical protein LWI28_005265 [Acer negundo]KAK4842672.1 hypothetical protein QYF36_025779 [Acer negundo]